MGEVEFLLPNAPGRTARRVRQTLYRETVTLPALRKEAPTLTVTAILAREEQPPAFAIGIAAARQAFLPPG